MTGTDDEYIWQLPDTTGLKHEVIMVGGRSAFDSAIRPDRSKNWCWSINRKKSLRPSTKTRR